MSYEFDVVYDRITSFDAPGYTDAEKSVFLTKAQERFVNTRYSYKGNKNQEGFEFTEKRRKELNELISNAVISSGANTPSNKPFAMFYDLPSDFLWAIGEEIDIYVLNCNGSIVNTRVPVKPIREDEYNVYVKNPFKKPYNNLVWRMDYSSDVSTKRHELIGSGQYLLQSYYLRYIRVPKPIIVSDISPRTIDGQSSQQDCELNESTHRDIIDMAVEIALETVQDSRLQSNILLNSENE